MTPNISENEKKYFWKNFGKWGSFGYYIFIIKITYENYNYGETVKTIKRINVI